MILKNKVALITGSSRGIGRAIAFEFAKQGADIILNYNQSEDNVRNVEKEIKNLGRNCYIIKADVSKIEEIKKK